MVKKSKLLAALDAHKGRDYEAEKQKKQLRAGEKAKSQKVARKAEQSADAEDADGLETTADDQEEGLNDETNGTNRLNGHSKPTSKEDIEDENSAAEDEEDEGDSDDASEDEEDIALSDLSEADLEDTVPHQRMTINNGPALLSSTSRIALLRKHPQKDRAPFHVHNSLISTLPSISSVVADPNDDLIREQAFYNIARAATVEARSLLKKASIPFSRPADYFAEMVKTEDHMGRIHKKQYDEAADRKGREAARQLRDAKKFGKKVQVAKEQERAKLKRDTLDKIKDLKRKRKSNPSEATHEPDADLFDVGVEKDDSRPSKSRRMNGDSRDSGGKRRGKDAKFGYGGKKRFSKSGDAESSADMRGFSAARMKGRGGGGARGGRGGGRGGSQRPGKSRRAAGRS